MDVDTKDAMRDLILSKEPEQLTPEERALILDYCASDVVGTEALLRYLLERNQIDWPRALWRGRYTIAVARMERVGVPVDVPLHRRLSANWPALRHELIANVNQTFAVFDDHDTFKTEKFIGYVLQRNLPWPKLPSGALALDGDTFDEMARFHPELRPLYEVRSSLGEMRLTGGNRKRSRSPPLCRTTRDCSPPTSPAIFISLSHATPASLPPAPPRNRTATSAICARPSCSASATAWAPKAWPSAPAFQSPKRAPCWHCTGTPTANSGNGPTARSRPPCSPAK
jgi:hypothetical protein